MIPALVLFATLIFVGWSAAYHAKQTELKRSNNRIRVSTQDRDLCEFNERISGVHTFAASDELWYEGGLVIDHGDGIPRKRCDIMLGRSVLCMELIPFTEPKDNLWPDLTKGAKKEYATLFLSYVE